MPGDLVVALLQRSDDIEVPIEGENELLAQHLGSRR